MNSNTLDLRAEFRTNLGKGENRRLRKAGRVPAIVYGGATGVPVPISLDQRDLDKCLSREAFYAKIFSLQLGDKSEQAVIKAVHRHPARPMLLHIDLQRVHPKHKLNLRIPLTFLNEAIAPGVKVGGGRVARLLSSVEIECLPTTALPSEITVDLAKLEAGHTIHLSHLVLPSGVTIRGLTKEKDLPVCAMLGGQRASEDEPGAPAAAKPATPAAKPAAAKPAAKPAAAKPATPAAKPAAKKK